MSAEEPQLKKPLHDWRHRAQVPALIFAIVGIGVSSAVIGNKLLAVRPHAAPGHLNRSAVAPFDLSKLSIPRAEIHRGGPPKDGIPALTNPAFLTVSEAAYLGDQDTVIGVSAGDQVKAYPLKILDYHEIVNDTLGGQPIAVTYCPLCDSSVVFDRRRGERTLEFGVSGLLYNSNVLMFNREPQDVTGEALWSQMGSVGVSSWGAKTRMRRLPIEVTTWKDWRSRHPETLVLSNDNGHVRSYDRTIYAHYFASESLMFPVNNVDDRLPPKTPVLGIDAGGITRAYPIRVLAGTGRRTEALGGAQFDLVAEPGTASVRVENATEGVEWCYSFWFAWSAFAPGSEIAQVEVTTR